MLLSSCHFDLVIIVVIGGKDDLKALQGKSLKAAKKALAILTPTAFPACLAYPSRALVKYIRTNYYSNIRSEGISEGEKRRLVNTAGLGTFTEVSKVAG